MKKLYKYLAQIGFGGYVGWRAILYYGRRYIKWVVSFSLIFLIVIGAYGLFPPYQKSEVNSVSSKTVFIPKGSSLTEIAKIMAENNLLQHKQIFIILGKISGYQNQLKAGLFEVPKDLHPWHLLNYLRNPRFADIKVTFPEGSRSHEMASILKEKLDSDSIHFMQLVYDSMLCDSFNIPAPNLEGYLLPETYFLTYGVNERDIIELLVNNTLSVFKPDSIQHRMQYLEMSRHEIITLASIIEGEVVVDSERVLVSSVYHNRLNRGWLLQADPTIQFILPGPPRRLLNKHLEIDSPYNTYRQKGLPPGPISNPGKQSIMAALYPADTKFMYFVATGDGGHYFARTAAEHARNKAKFDRVRREVRRNNR